MTVSRYCCITLVQKTNIQQQIPCIDIGVRLPFTVSAARLCSSYIRSRARLTFLLCHVCRIVQLTFSVAAHAKNQQRVCGFS